MELKSFFNFFNRIGLSRAANRKNEATTKLTQLNNKKEVKLRPYPF